MAMRTALVTGAGGDFGREIARALAAEGHRVVLSGRGDTVAEAAAALQAAGYDAVAERLDVADAPSIAALAERLIAAHGRVDILVNNAGIGIPRRGASGGVLAIDYLIHYGSPEQQQAYLPGMVAGTRIGAIAMTEPHAGSDLQAIKTTARRDGNQYVIDGSKTYISSGQNADFVIVAAKTDPAKGAKGTSLIIVDADTPGFARGRKLDKIGQHSADTSELFFDGVKVPITNCLGEENRGFAMIMTEIPQERVSQAIMGQAGAQRAFDEAVKFTKERAAFGKTVFDFQNTKFVLADMKAKLQVGWAHLDWMIQRLVAKELTAAEASAAKLWHTETQWEIVDMALQLHGGAGYMNEYPIARLWRDARVQRIYGGTSEILKEVIARAI